MDQCRSYLYTGFASKADKHKKQDGNDIVVETSPVVDSKGSHKSSHQHKKYRSRSKDGTTHQHNLEQTNYINNQIKK